MHCATFVWRGRGTWCTAIRTTTWHTHGECVHTTDTCTYNNTNICQAHSHHPASQQGGSSGVKEEESFSSSSCVKDMHVESVLAEMTEYSPSSGDDDAPSMLEEYMLKVPWYAQTWCAHTSSTQGSVCSDIIDDPAV